MALPEKAARPAEVPQSLAAQKGGQPGRDGLIISYLTLRQAVGYLGMALPFVLILGNLFVFSAGVQNSISAYYYTGMRDVFVGSVCAIAVFMISYHGPEKQDDIFGDLAFALAIGVALLPTAPEVGATPLQNTIGMLHYACAIALFLVLAWFCVLFRKTDPQRVPVTRRKMQRNVVYAACGAVILACIAGVVVVKLLGDNAPLKALKPVLVLETIALVAFGFAWFTKGEAILKDEASPEAGAAVRS